MAEQKLKSEKSRFLYDVHFKEVFRTAISLADLKVGETVLDFGCGLKPLKDAIEHYLPNSGIHYFGFDIVRERSDFNGFEEVKKHKFDCIFALSILEHLSIKELHQAFADFNGLGASRLIVSLPAENLLNRFLNFVRNDEELIFWYHITPSKVVGRELYNAFGSPYACRRVQCLKQVGVFEIKKKEAGGLAKNEAKSCFS